MSSPTTSRSPRTASPCLLATAVLVFGVVLAGCGEEQMARNGGPAGEEDGTSTEAYSSDMAAPSMPGGQTLPEVRQPVPPEHNTEDYDHVEDNPFVHAARQPLSTFSIDVDTASYSNVRRMLNQGRLPPRGAVRIEELVNYFPYDYAPPTGAAPFAVHAAVAACPWQQGHRLVRIGLKGREVNRDQRPPSNLVFLIDVSGSMRPSNKLPLVQQALAMLVERLGPGDRVAIVVYAGGAGLVLPSTPADDKPVILDAIRGLRAGGSTHGSAGIRLAYEQAQRNFIEGGTNRVILCTDGDFNVGTTSRSELVELIQEKAQTGVFLSVIGFGMGNYKDATMEQLADKGNGNYGYVDTPGEAQKLLVEQMSGTLVTIAKDVKVQVDFNPARVAAYRLIGYENRMLRAEGFRDDTKDAGEIGAGHTVTALYQIVPAGSPVPGPDVEPSKYVEAPAVAAAREDAAGELLTVRLRYKEPDAEESQPLNVQLRDESRPFEVAGEDFQFAAAVAEFGLLLRDSPHRGEADFDHLIQTACGSLGQDGHGYRAEFVELAEKAEQLSGGSR